MMDLAKWAEKTAQAVRQICLKKDAACIGFGLAFYDPMAEKDEQYSFNIHLAFDPNHPPEQVEIDSIRDSLEYIVHAVTQIMTGEPVDKEKAN